MTPRPTTLHEVGQRADSLRTFSYELADFLHEFQRAGTPEALQEEPDGLAGWFVGGELADAYLAAVAGTLADRLGLPRPSWTRRLSRYLRHPWFALDGPAMRATLLLESPPAFRERNLFVTANALDVA